MKRLPPLAIVAGLAALCLGACARDTAAPTGTEPYPLAVPTGWPDPPVRADNPLTVTSVQLGRSLFFDERLSLSRGLSCSSCHQTDRAFSDSVARSRGVDGRTGMRNAPSLANVAYHPLLLRDGGAPSLEQQVLVPFFDHRELDADPQQVVEALADDADVQRLSRTAYGRPFDLYVLTRSLANYLRTLLSGHSRYDLYLAGDRAALSPAETRGLDVFTGAGKCTACHAGHDLSDHGFHNTGLASDLASDPGRQRITLDPGDRGKFKTPTLRNIALTAPYMHDGSLTTLQAVVDHYRTGGKIGPDKDPLMMPLHLTDQQQADLIAFLHALTDVQPLDMQP